MNSAITRKCFLKISVHIMLLCVQSSVNSLCTVSLKKPVKIQTGLVSILIDVYLFISMNNMQNLVRLCSL